MVQHCSNENPSSANKLWDFYRLQRSWGKVMFLQASVILSTGGGVPDQVHPPDQVPPGPGTPPPPGPGTPPRTRYSPPRPGTPGTIYLPPGAEHAGRYGQHAGGTQSYWNAIMLI